MSDTPLDPRDPEFRAWPTLTFHYGLGFRDLMLMPRWMKREYLTELPKLIGRERLRAAEASVLPHVEQGTRDAIFADIRLAAGIGTRPGTVIEKPKFDGTLRSVGIGVKREPGKARGRVKPKVRPGQRMVPLDDASNESRHPEVTDA